MKQFGLAVVGAGEIAQNFHLPILMKLPNVKPLAICDKNKSTAAFVAKKYEIPFTCENIYDILDDDSIEAVDICASTDAHRDIAIAELEAGKSVLIEKPVARSLEEAKEIAEAEKKSKGKCMIGMTQRFRYDTIMLKNFVHSGELGDVFYIKAGWLQQKRGTQWLDQLEKSGGGVLLDLGISLIDSLVWIYDFAAVKSVKATMYQHQTKNVEDVCIATIHFENGSIATLEMSWSLFTSKNTFYCDVYGNNGSASVNPIQLFKNEEGVFHPVAEDPSRGKISIFKKSFESVLKHFANAVLDYAPVHSTAQEAVEIMKILRAMYRSADEQREVLLEEIS